MLHCAKAFQYIHHSAHYTPALASHTRQPSVQEVLGGREDLLVSPMHQTSPGKGTNTCSRQYDVRREHAQGFLCDQGGLADGWRVIHYSVIVKGKCTPDGKAADLGKCSEANPRPIMHICWGIAIRNFRVEYINVNLKRQCI